MVSPDNAITAAKWSIKGYQWASASDWLRRFRERRTLRLLSDVHLGFVHSARKLVAQMQQWDKADATALLALEVCTKAREAMCNVTGLSENKLHCCLKMMAQSNGDEPRVATWARSEPLDGRPRELGDEKAHPVKANSVWCALMGIPDAKTVWQPNFTCFACNDLPGNTPRFQCDRQDWQSYYRSALVFPMRYALRCDGSELANIGFIAFDSPGKNAFPGLPNIYDFVDKSAEYLDSLHKCPAFHLGAIFADTLGASLGTAYEASLKRQGTDDACNSEHGTRSQRDSTAQEAG